MMSGGDEENPNEKRIKADTKDHKTPKDFHQILEAFQSMQDMQTEKMEELQRRQQKDFEDMMIMFTQPKKEVVKTEIIETDVDKADATSAASEAELVVDHEAETGWADDQLKEAEAKQKKDDGNVKDGNEPYDPESPPFEPQASTSKMNPPPPPKADMIKKAKKEVKGDKKEEVDPKPEEKKFKAKRFLYKGLKIDAAKKLLGEEKFNQMYDPKPYNKLQYLICWHYTQGKCNYGDITGHKMKRKDGSYQLHHHGCEDCLEIRRALYGHPQGHKYCPFRGIHDETEEGKE